MIKISVLKVDTHLCLVFAPATLVSLVSEVGDADQATDIADVHAIRVGRLEQTLAQELRSAVRNLTIALHLSKTQPSVPVTDEPCFVLAFLC